MVFVSNLAQAIELMKFYDKILLADISGEPIKILVNLDQAFKSCSIIVGPEGGFTSEEIDKFKSLPNLQTLSLGPILLRAETAVLASLAILSQI